MEDVQRVLNTSTTIMFSLPPRWLCLLDSSPMNWTGRWHNRRWYQQDVVAKRWLLCGFRNRIPVLCLYWTHCIKRSNGANLQEWFGIMSCLFLIIFTKSTMTRNTVVGKVPEDICSYRHTMQHITCNICVQAGVICAYEHIVNAQNSRVSYSINTSSALSIIHCVFFPISTEWFVNFYHLFCITQNTFCFMDVGGFSRMNIVK